MIRLDDGSECHWEAYDDGITRLFCRRDGQEVAPPSGLTVRHGEEAVKPYHDAYWLHWLHDYVITHGDTRVVLRRRWEASVSCAAAGCEKGPLGPA